MDSIGASVETEQRAKGEALRVKKQLEGEINELEIGLDHANKANSEGLKSIKRYQGQLRETIQLYEDEARARAQISEQVGISERKAAALSGEVEESKALLDGADRSQRQLQGDIADSRAAVNNMQTINGRDMTVKRQLESSIHTMQAEVDGMLIAAKNAEEKSKKAMVDAARLADELRAEQDHCNSQAESKKALESKMMELDTKIADAEEYAIRGGRAVLAKMESRIRELELELGSVQAQTSENKKGFMRTEHKSKELAFQLDEDKSNQQRMTELASALQGKIKTSKKNKLKGTMFSGVRYFFAGSWRERPNPSLPTLKQVLEIKPQKSGEAQIKANESKCKGIVDISQVKRRRPNPSMPTPMENY